MTVTLLVVSVAYLLLSTPFHIADKFLRGIMSVDLHMLVISGMFALMMVNKSADFVIYAVANGEFRKSSKDILTKVGVFF